MKGFFFVLCTGALKAIWTTLFLRRARKRYRADPEAVKHIRLTPEGTGWWYEYGWPGRRKGQRHHAKAPDKPEDDTL